jgi:phosphatidylglycerophosphate synthase
MESSFLDRAFDGCVLGAIAWVSRQAEPVAAVGALAALSFSFLAAYVRARGAALGYAVGESGLSAGLRYGLVAAGLWLDALSWTIWMVAAMSTLSLLVRASQVVKEERL